MSAANLRHGHLTPDEERQVEALAALKWKPGRIAAKMERLPTTIYHAMTRLGLRAPVTRTYAVTRNGRPVVFFDADEDALLEAMRAEGSTWAEIARACLDRFGRGRSASTVGLRLKMLANRGAT